MRALLAALALVSGCGWYVGLGSFRPPAGRKTVVGVAVHGNQSLSDGEIEDRIAIHAENWALRGKPTLERRWLTSDARRIESLYASKGFFEARVTRKRVEDVDDQAVRVHFDVVEGPRTYVTRVRFRGIRTAEVAGQDEASLRLREIRERLPSLVKIEVGDPYDEATYNQAKEAIERALRERGFPFAIVLGEVRVSRAERAADVWFRIAEGPLARVREVRVQGNSEIPTARIERRIGIRPGDVPDDELLRDTEHDVYRLGVFFSVKAELVTPDVSEMLGTQPATYRVLRDLPWDPNVPVVVTVQEMPLREASVGVGVAIDNVRSEATARAGWQHRDLFGGLRLLSVEAQPAYVALPSLFDPEVHGPGGRATVLFRQPSFIEEYLQLMLRADYELDISYGYRSHAVRGALGFSRELGRRLTAEVSLNAEYYRFFDLSPSLEAPPEALGIATCATCIVTYIEQALTLDLRDSPFDARQGFYAQARFQESAQAFGSDFPYLRILTDLRMYFTPWKPLTLGLRVSFGDVLPGGDGIVPLPARFIGGGASDMRGFGARALGPAVCRALTGEELVVQQGEECPEDTERIPVGGNVKLIGSFETRWYLGKIGLVAFVDVGNVWATESEVNLRELQVAVGPGVRYFTPFGPIRADLGVLLTGPSAPDWVFHFSLGQAF